jgi:2,4-dienoyl-CoA reductase-like NADH-dependent reductase (Old Yellow Enzyme family)
MIPSRQAGQVGAPADTAHDIDIPEVDLFTPIDFRGVRLRHRVAMSPMCQYSAHDGFANDWHLVHLGSRAVGDVALVIVEATAVEAIGRITPADLGLWNDEQIEPLARIVRFVKEQGAVPGIQLAHAGRKGSCRVPWEGGARLLRSEDGWDVVAPSTIPFNEGEPTPIELDLDGIERIVHAFEEATRRALRAGFEVIEIHSAHGYLLHEFLSPLANRRTDEYGGSLENRLRLVVHVAMRVRKIIPEHLPLFVRISATDWVDGGWDINQSVVLARSLKEVGVDLIDVSSGGAVPHARIPIGSGYQVPFSRRLRAEAEIETGAVGLIASAQQADEIITSGDADVVLLGRELLRDPYWTIDAQHVLEEEPVWPTQYGYALKRRAK